MQRVWRISPKLSKMIQKLFIQVNNYSKICIADQIKKRNGLISDYIIALNIIKNLIYRNCSSPKLSKMVQKLLSTD